MSSTDSSTVVISCGVRVIVGGVDEFNAVRDKEQRAHGGYRKSKEPRKKNTPWTAEKDERLRELVKQYGRKWEKIQKADPIFKDKSKDSLKMRFKTFDEEGTTKNGEAGTTTTPSPWTAEKDERLRELVKQYGRKWTSIQKADPIFKDKSPDTLKQRFNTFDEEGSEKKGVAGSSSTKSAKSSEKRKAGGTSTKSSKKAKTDGTVTKSSNKMAEINNIADVDNVPSKTTADRARRKQADRAKKQYFVESML